MIDSLVISVDRTEKCALNAKFVPNAGNIDSTCTNKNIERSRSLSPEINSIGTSTEPCTVNERKNDVLTASSDQSTLCSTDQKSPSHEDYSVSINCTKNESSNSNKVHE
jgi:hypothetical protein